MFTFSRAENLLKYLAFSSVSKSFQMYKEHLKILFRHLRIPKSLKYRKQKYSLFYELHCIHPNKFTCWSPNSQYPGVTVFGDMAFKKDN